MFMQLFCSHQFCTPKESGENKMSDYTKCPNCTKKGLIIPLSKDDKGLVCALCNSVFELSLEDE